MKTLVKLLILCQLILLSSCQAASIHELQLAKAISNNAIAKATVLENGKKQTWFYSFNGLTPGKTWKDVSSAAFAINPANGQSKQLTDVPGDAGRLASIAATVDNQIYIFGGYTVGEDHSEVSTPEVYRFDPKTERYELVTIMPTPVDDSVALVYQDRFIYLISGWHNHGNVDLVQILDTQDMSWHLATPYPGAPVFGQAAGIVGDKMIVSDGVKVVSVTNGKRQYGMSNDNYLGKIDPDDFKKISWTKLEMHPGSARYRMASSGSKHLNKVVFVGGSDNPYNFNGIGYNGEPSQPNDLIFAYNFSASQWEVLGKQTEATMDHRGLLEIKGDFYTIGGMLNNQIITNGLLKVSL